MEKLNILQPGTYRGYITCIWGCFEGSIRISTWLHFPLFFTLQVYLLSDVTRNPTSSQTEMFAAALCSPNLSQCFSLSPYPSRVTGVRSLASPIQTVASSFRKPEIFIGNKESVCSVRSARKRLLVQNHQMILDSPWKALPNCHGMGDGVPDCQVTLYPTRSEMRAAEKNPIRRDAGRQEASNTVLCSR